MAGSSATNLMGLMSGINQGFQGLGSSLDPMFQNLRETRLKKEADQKEAMGRQELSRLSQLTTQYEKAVAAKDSRLAQELLGTIRGLGDTATNANIAQAAYAFNNGKQEQIQQTKVSGAVRGVMAIDQSLDQLMKKQEAGSLSDSEKATFDALNERRSQLLTDPDTRNTYSLGKQKAKEAELNLQRLIDEDRERKIEGASNKAVGDFLQRYSTSELRNPDTYASLPESIRSATESKVLDIIKQRDAIKQNLSAGYEVAIPEAYRPYISRELYNTIVASPDANTILERHIQIAKQEIAQKEGSGKGAGKRSSFEGTNDKKKVGEAYEDLDLDFNEPLFFGLGGDESLPEPLKEADKNALGVLAMSDDIKVVVGQFLGEEVDRNTKDKELLTKLLSSDRREKFLQFASEQAAKVSRENINLAGSAPSQPNQAGEIKFDDLPKL